MRRMGCRRQEREEPEEIMPPTLRLDLQFAGGVRCIPRGEPTVGRHLIPAPQGQL